MHGQGLISLSIACSVSRNQFVFLIKESAVQTHSNLQIAEQKHVTVEVGRNLWRSFSPTPFSRQGQLEQATQDCVQMAVGYIQR